VGRLASVRQLARRLVFADLVPRTTAPPVEPLKVLVEEG